MCTRLIYKVTKRAEQPRVKNKLLDDASRTEMFLLRVLLVLETLGVKV